MRIIFKYGNGLVSMDFNNPTFPYLEWNQEFQDKMDLYIKPDINENYTDIIETATPEEIAEANKSLVPETLHRMGLKIQLLLKGIEISEIIDAINSIPDSMFPQFEKQIAIIKFEEAAYFDRYNADLNLVAVMMELTQDDLDEIFINGNKV